jgi:hypothetical protein
MVAVTSRYFATWLSSDVVCALEAARSELADETLWDADT